MSEPIQQTSPISQDIPTPANLTIARRLILPVEDAAPYPDSSVVVFSRVNSGRRFHSIIEPDGKFRGPFFRKLVVEAYAVTHDADIRHELERLVQTWDRAGSFTLRVALYMSVQEPRVIAEKIASDPLRRVEEEAAAVLEATASRVAWAQVEDDGIDFDRRILDGRSTDASGQEISNFGRLHAFSQRLGIKLHNVEVGVTFSPEFGEAIRAERGEIKRQRIERARAETLRLQQENRLSIEREQLATEGQLADMQRQLKAVTVKAEGAQHFRTHVLGLLEQTLGRISDGIETTPALVRVIDDLRALEIKIAQLGSLNEEGTLHLPSVQKKPGQLSVDQLRP